MAHTGTKPDYLPEIDGTRVGASGMRLKDNSDTQSALVQSLIALVMVPGALTFIASNWGDVFEMIFAGFFLLIGLLVAYSAIHKIRLVRKLDNPTLVVEHWPLRLGQKTRLRFERKGKNGTAIERVGAKIVLREVARYRVGTDTRTVTEDVFEKSLGVAQGTGVLTKCDFVLEMPRDQAASFHSSHNRLESHVELTMIYPGGKDDSSFELLVLPELAA